MRNITLAIEESLLQQARVLAERRNTSLNALVRSLLACEVEHDERIAIARNGIRELIEQSTLEFEPGANVKELARRHDVPELHGHQHSNLGGHKKAG